MNQPGTIQYQHPEYGRRWWNWELARVSYVGGRDYLRPTRLSIDYQYPEVKQVDVNGALSTIVGTAAKPLVYSYLLHRQTKEQPWEYENRVSRASYTNFFAPIINALVSETMRQPPTRDGDEQMLEFWKHPDEKREQSMDAMMRDGLTWASTYGIEFAFVDKNPEPDPAEGEDDKPYFYWVSPLDIIDWAIDDDGCYEWIKQFVYTEAPRTWKDPVTPLFQYIVWGKDTIDKYQTSATGGDHVLLESRPNVLGVVPVVPLYSKRDKDCAFPNGHPVVGDLAKVSNTVFNLQSWLLQILSDQTFGQLLVPSTQFDKIQLGTSRAVGYDPVSSSGAKPEYISPDPENARVIMESIGSLIELARQAAGIGRGRSEGSKDKASGAAMELEAEGKKNILGDIAESAQDFEPPGQDGDPVPRGEARQRALRAVSA